MNIRRSLIVAAFLLSVVGLVRLADAQPATPTTVEEVLKLFARLDALNAEIDDCVKQINALRPPSPKAPDKEWDAYEAKVKELDACVTSAVAERDAIQKVLDELTKRLPTGGGPAANVRNEHKKCEQRFNAAVKKLVDLQNRVKKLWRR